MQLAHLASRLYGTPLLITRSKLDVLLSVLGSRIGFTGFDVALPPPTTRAITATQRSGIAVIPVHGTLVRRTMGVEAASGLTSYSEIATRLDAALADSAVSGILLELDSPGGEAGGVFELAERIRAANAIKPVWAHANDSAYSAAYAIAAAASRLTLSATAGLGSIGVIALHADQSVKDDKDGLRYTAIYAGHHKNDLSPHAPLSTQAAAGLQSEVDRLYGIFIRQVAQMRTLAYDTVRQTEAGLFFGEDAVVAGLADAVISFDQVLIEFSEMLKAQQRLARPVTPIANHSGHHHPHRETPMHAHNNPGLADQAAPAQPSSGPDPAPPVTEKPGNGRSEALAIAEICLIAGLPQRTADFLASGMSEHQVRHALLEARAEQPEITSRISADTGSTPVTESSTMLAAVKRLIKRE